MSITGRDQEPTSDRELCEIDIKNLKLVFGNKNAHKNTQKHSLSVCKSLVEMFIVYVT